MVAQQVLALQNAVQQRCAEFLYEGQTVHLREGCAVFITLNPGSAGRAELPDNLKALPLPLPHP